MDWKKILLAAGGAAGAAAVLYYLLRDDPEAEAKLRGSPTEGNGSAPQINVEELLAILRELAESEPLTKTNTRSLSKELSKEADPLATDAQFAELFKRVAASKPEDPLQKRGLGMPDLEGLLAAHQTNPDVIAAFQRLQGVLEPGAKPPTGKAKEITIAKIAEIQVFMQQQLKDFIERYERLADKSHDPETVIRASQVIVDSRVTAKYSFDSEDMESAMMANQEAIAKNPTCKASAEEYQRLMMQLLQSLPINR